MSTSPWSGCPLGVRKAANKLTGRKRWSIRDAIRRAVDGGSSLYYRGCVQNQASTELEPSDRRFEACI